MKSEPENQSRQFEKAIGCPQKVYVVMEGEYDDYHIDGIFSSRELADKYVEKMKTVNNPQQRHFSIINYTVDAREKTLYATEFWYYVQICVDGKIYNYPDPSVGTCPYGDFEKFQKDGYYFHSTFRGGTSCTMLLTYISAGTYDQMVDKAVALHKQIIENGTWDVDEKNLKKS